MAKRGFLETIQMKSLIAKKTVTKNNESNV